MTTAESTIDNVLPDKAGTGRAGGSGIETATASATDFAPSWPAFAGAADYADQRFAGQDVPCPPYWGGYRLVPASIELWQGRPSRMHDRLRYERDDPAALWRIVRLSP